MAHSRVPRRGPRRLLVPALAFTVGALLASSCAETASPGGGAACTFGQSIRCEGPAGCPGTSVCLDDLSAFGPCTCADAGPPGDAGDAGDSS